MPFVFTCVPCVLSHGLVVGCSVPNMWCSGAGISSCFVLARSLQLLCVILGSRPIVGRRCQFPVRSTVQASGQMCCQMVSAGSVSDLVHNHPRLHEERRHLLVGWDSVFSHRLTRIRV